MDYKVEKEFGHTRTEYDKEGNVIQHSRLRITYAVFEKRKTSYGPLDLLTKEYWYELKYGFLTKEEAIEYIEEYMTRVVYEA